MLYNNNVVKKFAVALVAATFAVSAAGCGTGSGKNVQIDGVSGPNVGFVDGKFMMNAVLKNVTFDGGIRVPIPHMPNSYFEVGPDFQSTGTLISVAVDTADLTYVSDHLELLQPNSLPGGRPLPGVMNGQLPSIAVQVNSFMNSVFYIGPHVFGIFIPIKLGMQGYIGTFRFYDQTNSPIGTLSVVGEDADKKNSGFLLLINIAGKVAALMQK